MWSDDKKYAKQAFEQFYSFPKLVHFEERETRKFFQ